VGYLPFYLMVAAGWHSALVSSVLAAAHSLSIGLLYLIARELFAHLPARERTVFSCLAAALGAASARAVRVDRSVDWLGDARNGIALSQDAPGRIFTLAPGKSVTIRGARVTALGEAAPLGAFPYTQAERSVRRALLTQVRHVAFATWARRRQNQSLSRLTCQHDQAPQPATVDLTAYAPFLAL